MFRCQECGESYQVGTLFCAECGNSLYADEFDTLVQPTTFQAKTAPVIDGHEQLPVSAGEFVFSVFNSGRHVTLRMDDEIHIGRNDPKRKIHPDLDLTSDDGATLGVSRLHASLRSTKNGVMLVDLGSTNGTYLREDCLIPHKPSRLQSGDIFHLGHLQVQVFFEI